MELDTREGNTWAFMYITTAGITGVFFVGMLLYKPVQTGIAQMVLLALALIFIVGSLPRRKGMAISLDYLSELLWDNHQNRSVREDRK